MAKKKPTSEELINSLTKELEEVINKYKSKLAPELIADVIDGLYDTEVEASDEED